MLQELLTGMFLWRLGNTAKFELAGRYKFAKRPFTHELSHSKNLTIFQGTKDGDESIKLTDSEAPHQKE